ncbi:dentin sialophosphoprotein-like [Macrobrachium rosenbergii]|uniref:dentin sialophosphoprotein-like n=1 Tax=Macrobrachium rosenbergii TaxID=79674 RepID=UPI0034D57974
MEIASGSNHTPSRKMSLRRKRSIKTEGAGGSPAHKKTSPVSARSALKTKFADNNPASDVSKRGFLSVETAKNAAESDFSNNKSNSADGDASGDTDLSQVYHTRRTFNLLATTSVAGFTTPKNRRSKRRTGSSEKRSDEDSRTKELEEQRLHQHSPDTPFMSSQLCGTQECEVVWDCNSPGFSKDDLKRMCGDTGSDESTSPAVPVFVAPMPTRALFTRNRSRHCSNISAVDTTAQLDELLNQLSAKGSLSKDSQSVASSSRPEGDLESTSSTENELISHTPPAVKDSQPATPPVPFNLITEASSEPFEVWDESQVAVGGHVEVSAIDDQADVEILEETTWDDDLNMAVCDISGRDIMGDSPSKSAKSKSQSCNISKDVSKVKNNESLDVFDDDYFNDTLIESTQMWEKEILEKGIENATLHIATSKTKASEDDYNERNVCDRSSAFTNVRDRVDENNCTNGGTSRLGKSVLLPFRTKSVGNVSKNTSEESLKSNVVEDNPRRSHSMAEKAPQRRIRSSFRLSDNPQTGLLYQKSKHIHPSPSKDTKLGQKNSLVNNTQKSSSSDVTSVMTEAGLGSSMPLLRYRNLEPNMPKVQTPKPLFAGDNSYRSIEKSSGKTELSKSSFPRSQSTGNSQGPDAKCGISRPSKSEDTEGSREFEEDDSFFDSLLSTLPEEEIILGMRKNSQAPGVHNKKTHFAKEMVTTSKNMHNSSVNNAEKSKVFSRWSDKRKSSNSCVKDINDQNRNPQSSSVLGSSCVNSTRSNIIGNVQSKGCSMPGKKSLTTSPAKSPIMGMSALKLRTRSESNQETDSISALCNSSIKQEFKGKSNAGDISDDDLFEDDVLSLIDEVESQFGSQPLTSAAPSSQSSQLSLSQQNKCTSEEIAKKKEEAQRRREERLKMEETAKREDAHHLREVGAAQYTTGVERTKSEANRQVEAKKKDVAVCFREEKQKAEAERPKVEPVSVREEKLKGEEIAKKREEAQRRKDEKQKMEEIARKKEAALRRREERQRSRQLQCYPPVVKR